MSINIVEVVKAHPIPIGIGVVVILLIVFSRGSSPSSSGASNAGAYLQSQQTASSANVALAGLNSQTQVALGAQSVDNNRIAMEAAGQRSGVMAGIFSVMTQANAEVSATNGANTLKSFQTMMASKQNILMAENDYDIQKRTVSAGITMKAADLASQIRMNENDNNTKLSAIGLATNGELNLLREEGTIKSALADKNASLMSLMADKSFDFQAKTMPTVLQHAQNMQQIGGANAQALARITGEFGLKQTELETYADRRRARADAAKSDWGVVGNVIGGVAKIFGF
jgi:hypothetical protein